MMDKKSKLGFVGAGRMASAIIAGVCKSAFLPKENIFAYDVSNDALEYCKKEFDINISSDISCTVGSCDVLLVATKPFVINEVLDTIKDDYKDQLIISVLAGTKTSTFEQKLQGARVIRVMPNTPAFVNEGAFGICKGKNATDEDVEFVKSMLSSLGSSVVITEDKFDALTALSGSGPAFYYKIIDLMARSAVKFGLTYEDAILLSTQTALGSAKMMMENDFKAQDLINAVSTKGGCTEVGNNVLIDSNIDEIFDKLIEDTMNKAKSLG